MSEKNHGMQAFPRAPSGTDGMSLRDYFAAKAMQGLLSSESWREAFERSSANRGAEDDRLYWMGTSVQAYFMADEMLKAREA